MKAFGRGVWSTWLGGLLILLLVAWVLVRSVAHPGRRAFPQSMRSAPVLSDPYQQAMAEARALHLHAQTESKLQLEALEESDPDALSGSAPEELRRLFLARTRELGQARSAADRAVTLARAPEEQYQATRLLARLECEAGRHGEELRLAHRLVKLRPGDWQGLRRLQQAAVCTGDERLARMAAARLGASQELPWPLPK